MKRKIVIGVLALAMVIPMSACSSKTEDKAQTNVSQSDDKQKKGNLQMKSTNTV